ncbi:ABC transporter ATP-binding protein [Slackia piriformis]|uniref:ABC transporter ATP-binding protein n=1 Tax=Slackia piriformis TaxID=626934 RepID=UPI0023F0EAFB|nr:ABC transporter ATP-binding protein [Slackia piriformis]
MRIIRYLKGHIGALVLIIALLVVQAFADLSLPRYTSDLVDVGIQQGGIDCPSPSEFTADTFEAVCMLASPDEEDVIRSSYDEVSDGSYAINEKGLDNRDELDEALAKPFAEAHFARSESAQQRDGSVEGEDTSVGKQRVSDAQGEGSYDFDALLDAYRANAVSKEEVSAFVAQAESALAGIDDPIIEQQAIAAAKAEYEKLGYDMGSLQMSYLFSIGAKMLGVAAVMMLASIAVGFLASRTAAKVARGLRERLFARVLAFSDAEVQAFSAASLITRGTNDIQQIQMVLVVLLRMVLYAPILAVGGMFMVSSTNFSMSWIIALAVAAIFMVIFILMAVAMPKFKIMQKLIDRVNLVSREMLNGISVIRAFGRQSFEEDRFDEANVALMKTQLFTNRAMTFMMPMMMLIMNAVSVLIVWVGGSYIDSGAIQTGDMIAFITYSMVIIMSFLMMGMVSVMLPRADVAAQRVNEVLEMPVSIGDPDDAVAAKLAGSKGARIEFRDVTFAYDKGSEPVLKNVSFVAEPGKTTAIIGSTGSGKSTVIKLIERFYDVTSGAVLLDGVDVRRFTQRDLRAQLGYVPQKAFLFSGTVRSNVAYADESMDAEQVALACDIAQASEFVESRPEGLEAEVSQGGSNVSGGQRQRLSIARALACDARVLLFDDSFSALDYKTDARLREGLAKHLGSKTVIIVAQRIATVLSADRIVVLENGCMVGCGTHEELMASCETYQEIALSQLSEEELKGGDSR